MSLIRISERTLINSDAIAWIDFEADENSGQRAVVHFLLADRTGDLVTQFTGTDARCLEELVPHRENGKEPKGPVATFASFQPDRKKKAWYFSRAVDRPLFLAFINAKGSCSLRSYDAETGIFVGKQYGTGDYQDAFPELLKNSREVIVESQPNLERDCKARLPDRVLTYLKAQIEQENIHV